MITRIVQLKFNHDFSWNAFRKLYEERNPATRGVPGCVEVKIMKDVNAPNIYYTVSKWSSNEALENYRSSEYFAETWPMVKSTLAEKANAFTIEDL